jgi:predicted DCC family thiol-disulfide oxidoreductase YuxK
MIINKYECICKRMSPAHLALKPLTLFYDGACPLCQAEIVYLASRNHQGLLYFVDINGPEYDPQSVGVSCEQALARMYGQLEGQEAIHGVPVFAEAYRRANLPLLAWLFSQPLLRPIWNLSYRFFAKYRHTISGLIGPFFLRLAKRVSHSKSTSI